MVVKNASTKKAGAKKSPAKKKAAVVAGPQLPSPGRIVLYVLAAEDPETHEHDVRPAIVVRVLKVADPPDATEVVGENPEKPGSGSRADAAARRAAAPVKRAMSDAINLVVFCDGQNDDTEVHHAGGTAWYAHVRHDEAKAPGTWHWPTRV